jgi:hypothetical protein
MVEAEPLGKVNEQLAPTSVRIAMVPIGQCDLLEKNARFMRAEQYQRLVSNVKRDGCLTSVPFAVKNGERFLILSGNHRVQAAKDAKLTEILVLYSARELSPQEQRAIQLSHNAIAGQDDLAILRELYDEINDVALKEYSGLDDVVLGRMNPPQLDPLSEMALEYRIVSIVFLPPEAKRAEALFAKIMEQALGDELWVNRFTDYDRMLDALAIARKQAGVKNTATAFGLLLDIVEKHLGEIPRPQSKKAKDNAKETL